jgi:hypothetical protein
MKVTIHFGEKPIDKRGHHQWIGLDANAALQSAIDSQIDIWA